MPWNNVCWICLMHFLKSMQVHFAKVLPHPHPPTHKYFWRMLGCSLWEVLALHARSPGFHPQHCKATTKITWTLQYPPKIHVACSRVVEPSGDLREDLGPLAACPWREQWYPSPFSSSLCCREVGSFVSPPACHQDKLPHHRPERSRAKQPWPETSRTARPNKFNKLINSGVYHTAWKLINRH